MSDDAPISTLYYEIQKVSELENLVEICVMAMLGIVGLYFGFMGIYVVQTNPYLKGLVKHYIMIDLVNSITILLGHSIWGVPCAIWDLNESFPFVDYLISDLVFTAIALGYFPKLFLGMNRFFAIAFDGRFFKRFEQLKLLQYFLMIVYPFVCFVLLLIPGCYAVYIPYGQNLFYSESECGDLMINYTGNVEGVFFTPVSIFFDLLVLILLHRRFRALHKEQHQQSSEKARDLRREYRLAAQLVTNLFNGITLSIASITFKTTFTTPLWVFISVTALWLLTCLLTCMAYALFLGESKSRKVETRKVSTVSLGISKTSKN